MAKDNLLNTEQEHHRRAFEQYYALGEKRSYRLVAQQLQVSTSAIKLWSRSFDWRKRLQERDAQLARQVADRAIQTGLEEHGRNRKIVQMALMKLAKGIADGKVRMQMGDLDRLIRLQQYLDTVDGGNLAQRPKMEIAASVQQSLQDLTTDELLEAKRFFEAVRDGKIREEKW